MTLILSCVHLDDFLVVSSPLSVASTWVCRRNRHVNTGIYVRLCGNKVLEKKSVWLFCGLDDEVDRRGKKSEVRSQDECILVLAPSPGTIILSLQTSHPFIHFHWVLCRTQNRLFSSIWYQVMGPWERREDHMPRFSPFPPPS